MSETTKKFTPRVSPERCYALDELRERAEHRRTLDSTSDMLKFAADTIESTRRALASTEFLLAAVQNPDLSNAADRIGLLSQEVVQLQAQLTEVTRELTAERHAHNVCSEGQQLIIDKLNQYEAALAPLRAVVEEIRKVCAEAQADHLKIHREMPWFNANSETYRVNAAKFLVAQQVLNALPADPCAPTPEKE